MMDIEKREEVLNKYFSKKIIELLANGAPENLKLQELYKAPISYAEAVSVLEHTISEIKKVCVIQK